MDIKVKKRNGNLVPFNFDKIYTHIQYAVDGLDCDINEIVNNFRIRLYDGITTEEIQKSLTLSIADLIDEDHPDYQYAACRTELQNLYKRIYGSFTPKFDLERIKTQIKNKIYDPELFKYYTEKELKKLLKVIDFKNDYKFGYLGINQMLKKYAIKRDGQAVETPQEIYFMIPLYVFARIKDKKERRWYVKNFYKALANFDIFLPTPDMAGIRTTMRGFTSCAGLNTGDSIESISNSAKSMFKLITKLRAGIGIKEEIRGLGADIGNGFEEHTGTIPYLQVQEKISKSSTQPNSGRTGSTTMYYPFFHYEYEDLVKLKNNRGSEEMSVRQADHAFSMDLGLLFERLEKNEEISLFHLNTVNDLWDKIGTEKFKDDYEKYEKEIDTKKTIKAEDFFKSFVNERYSTNRNYLVNAKAMQQQSAWKLPVNTSNLCLEIALPSFPDEDYTIKVKSKKKAKKWLDELYANGKWFQLYRYFRYGIIDIDNSPILNEMNQEILDENGKKFKINFGETFACILGGVNFGNLPENVEDRRKFFEKNMKLLVKFLDEKIEYQDYFGIDTFEKFTKNRRALGISPGNLFYLLAKNDADYNSQKARDLVNEVMEEFLYYGLKASNEIAKEKGACNYFKDTKYSDGLTPEDWYEKNVDELVSHNPNLDWEKLKNDIKKDGLRNSTILTAVPSSNSSRPAGMISGINMPKSLKYSVEDNKINVYGVLPEVKKYKEFYKRNLALDSDVLEYWKLIAVIQKWTDQAISLNENVDFTKFPNKKIPFNEVLRRFYFMYKYGIKTLYYVIGKTDDHSKNDVLQKLDDEVGCAGGGCSL